MISSHNIKRALLNHATTPNHPQPPKLHPQRPPTTQITSATTPNSTALCLDRENFSDQENSLDRENFFSAV